MYHKASLASNPCLAIKQGHTYITFLADLWSEKNGIPDILKTAGRLRIMSFLSRTLFFMGMIVILAAMFLNLRGNVAKVILSGSPLAMFIGVVVKLFETGPSHRYVRFKNHLRELLNSKAWKWIEMEKPGALEDLYQTCDALDEWMTAKCVEILAHQNQGNLDQAAEQNQQLRDQSVALEEFSSLGDDWKVYFAAASVRMGGNDYVI